MKRPLLIIAAAVLALGYTVIAGAAEVPVRLIAPHPADDHSPAVSPDGRWLVFVSERTGQSGLYSIRLDRGDTIVPSPHLPHPARTDSPVFSPNGRFLAFVSARQDALGDVWIQEFPGGQPKRLTERGEAAFAPAFSHDDNLLHFRTERPGRETVHRVHTPATGGTRTLAEEPSLLPKAPPYPLHALDATGRSALLYSEDTNRDGRLGEGDAPVAWVLTGDRWHQVSYPIPGAHSIARNPRTGDLYIAAPWSDVLDIGLVRNPHLAPSTTVEELLAEAEHQMRSSEDALEEAIALCREAWRRESPGGHRDRIAHRVLQLLRRAERFGQAQDLGARYLAEGMEEPARSLVRAEVLSARVEAGWVEARRNGTPFTIPPDAAEELSELRDSFRREGLAPEAAEVTLAIARFHLLQARPTSALRELESLPPHEDGLEPEAHARAAILRGEAYRALELGPETTESLLAIYTLGLEDVSLLDAAASALIDVALEGEEGPRQVLALRNLAARARPHPHLLARLLLAEAALHAAPPVGPDEQERHRALREASELVGEAPVPAVEAGLLLAGDLIRAGKLEEAVALLSTMTRRIGEEGGLRRYAGFNRLRDRAVESYLQRGREELLLGDTALARATYDRLLRFNPGNIQAWRGKIQASAGRPDLLEEMTDDFRRQARARDASALDHYKLGLALSYHNPLSREALRAVRRASGLEPSPYFALTEGFLLEQRFHARREGGGIDFRPLEEAMDVYERGLALAGDGRDRQLKADLLLNSGNTALALGQFARAHSFYTRRTALGAGFADLRTEMLFHWNSGIAAYRTFYSERAAREFARALDILDRVEAEGLLGAGEIRATERELKGRRALALMDAAPDSAEAERLFASLSGQYPERSLARVRMMRNVALIRENRMAAVIDPIEERALLVQTRSLLEEALDLVGRRDLEGDEGGRQRLGLINITAVVADQGGRLDAFSRSEEEAILRGMLARTLQRLGDERGAMEQLEQKAALTPLRRDATIYQASTRSVLLHRLSGQALRAGQWTRAANKAWEGLSLSHRDLPDGPWVDLNGATLHLLRIVELLGESDAILPAPPRPARWMLDRGDAAGEAGWPLLGTMAERLLARQDSEDIQPAAEARLLLMRVFALEASIRNRATEPGREGLELIRGQAETLREADRLRATLGEMLLLSDGRTSLPEVRRYTLLAYGGLLRVEGFLQAPPSGRMALLDEALAFATARGFAHRHWWLYAMAGLEGDDPQWQAERLHHALEELLQLPARSMDPTEHPPWALLDTIEERSLRIAIDAGDYKEAWNLVDGWRRARLRWLAEFSNPHPRTNAAKEWQSVYLNLRRDWVQAQQAMQRDTSANATTPPPLPHAGAEAALSAIAAHLEDGRITAPALAEWYAPMEGGFSDAEQVFMVERALNPGFSLLLHRQLPGDEYTVIYTREGERRVDLPEAASRIDGALVLGDPTGLPGAIHALTSRSAAERYYALSVRPPRELRIHEEIVAEDLPRLRSATSLHLDEPLELAGYRPGDWIPEGWSGRLDTLLRDDFQAEAVALQTRSAEEVAKGKEAAARLALLAAMLERGVGNVRLDGEAWIGRILDPRENRGEAARELAEYKSLWNRIVEEDEEPEPTHATLLEAIAWLSEVLGEADELADVHGNLTDVLADLGNWEAAVASQRKAVEILEETAAPSLRILVGYTRLGDAASHARDWETAFSAYQKAMELAHEMDDLDAQFSLRRKLSDAHERQGDYFAAVQVAEESLELIPAEMHVLRAEEHLRLARLFRVYQSRFDDALDRLEQAAREADNADSDRLRFEVAINKVRCYQSLALFDLGMEKLTELWEDAARDEPLLDPALLARRKAEILLEQSNIHWLRSEYLEAFNTRQEAHSLASSQEGMSDILIALYNASGLISWAVNDLDRALLEFNTGHNLAMDYGWPDLVATTRNNIGLVHRTKGDHLTAIEWFTHALETDREQGNRWGEAYALRNIGIARTLDGRPAEAVEPLRLAVSLSTEIGDRVNMAKAWTALGDALLDTGRFAEAETSFRTGRELAVNTPVPEMHWRALYGLGRLHVARGEPEEGLPYLEQAIDIVDGLRASIRIEEFQDGFLLDKQDLYDLTVQTHLDVGNEEQAFEASEKSRGRNFIDLLGNKELVLHSEQDVADMGRAEQLRVRVEEAQRALGAAGESRREEAEIALARARQDYDDFHIGLRSRNPHLASFRRVAPLSLAEVQSHLDNDTALLVYHLLPDEVVLFLIDAESLRVTRVSVAAADIISLVGNFRLGIQELRNVEADSLRLGRHLITPILSDLSAYRRVGIVPHRELHLLPFAALSIGGGDYLLDRVALFHAPSASLLDYTITRRERRSGPGRVLAIGNPRLESEAMDLPFAEKEAERLQLDFADVTVRLRDRASEDWLRAHASDFDIIHIASHGEFVEAEPMRSALLLAPGQGEADGRLSVEDIFGLNLNADLIVLSACQTGLGKLTAGDGLVGLNQAFVFAGTRQLVSTLWRVDDLSTALLFKYFYRNLEGQDRAEALRRAQIRLRSRPEFQHPAHWAGVVLSGDWE